MVITTIAQTWFFSLLSISVTGVAFDEFVVVIGDMGMTDKINYTINLLLRPQ